MVARYAPAIWLALGIAAAADCATGISVFRDPRTDSRFNEALQHYIHRERGQLEKPYMFEHTKPSCVARGGMPEPNSETFLDNPEGGRLDGVIDVIEAHYCTQGEYGRLQCTTRTFRRGDLPEDAWKCGQFRADLDILNLYITGTTD